MSFHEIMLSEYPLANKNKKKLLVYNRVGDIYNELRDGYFHKSNIHYLLYTVLSLFESSFNNRRLQAAELKWLSWFWFN